MAKQYGPTDIKASAIELIGNTPMVALDRIWPGPGRILVKCEFMNPGGSIKDRAALGMISGALANGQLKPNGPIVEMTSGNTGAGLAVIAAVMGHPLTLTMSAGCSAQRAVMMRALGANLMLAPQVEGSPGKVTHVGSAGAYTGVSQYLKSQSPDVKCFVGEPAGAEAVKGLPVTKPIHMLMGSGFGKIVPLFSYDTMDGTVSVTDEEAVKYKKLLARKEGLYVGYTSGANVAAAVKLFESGQVPADAWVVTLLNDTGLKYPE
ncbi:unnamed protein product [Medioppia subpectinata]|uniref:L-serine ammonia-lyase n=1 Tax=Medioppia subpectinata TaxID=1979941 RepID=A0A7R9KN27_9ACAR|nr:unnamed protein product [Medioppia subpectinata]CAG2105441.1 unnamed protein product [Medioppia subpectinata]